MDFEDILEEIGDYGVFQKRLVYLFLIPNALLLPLLCMTTLFMVSSPDHWCRVDALSNLTQHQQQQLISPLVVKNNLETFDSCNMYDIDYQFGLNFTLYLNENNSGGLPVKACDNGWDYDNTYYDETAVTAFDLVCDRNHYASIILSIGSLGTVIGTPIFSLLSDKIGRRKTFFITVVVFLISTLSPTIFKDLKSFIIFRIINGTILPSIFQIPYVVLIEMVGPKVRAKVTAFANISWVLGLCVLPVLAYVTRHWVILNIATSLTGFIFFAYWKFLPESPRFLLVNKRYEETRDQLIKIAKINHKPVPNDLIDKLKKVGKKISENTSEENEKNSLVIIASNPGIRKLFLLITVNWMANLTAYSGIHYNIHNFHGNQFINFFLLAIIELPSYLATWYCMQTKLGRRWSNVMFMILCGITLCIPAIVPSDYTTLINIVTLIGKFGVSASFMCVYQQAAELYPTPIRNQGLGAGSMISSILNIGLPYLAYLGQYGVWIPLTLMGMTSIIVGLLSTLLPETLNENLPQTIEDAEAFGKHRKYFSWAKSQITPKNKITETSDDIFMKTI